MEEGRICSLCWDMHPLLLWDIGVPGSQAFGLLAFRVFQLTDSRLWDFSVVILVWANPLINVLIYKEFSSVSVENRGQIRDNCEATQIRMSCYSKCGWNESVFFSQHICFVANGKQLIQKSLSNWNDFFENGRKGDFYV